jgi:hypothetical protein
MDAFLVRGVSYWVGEEKQRLPVEVEARHGLITVLITM